MIWDEERFWHRQLSSTSSILLRTPINIILTGAALDRHASGISSCSGPEFRPVGLLLRRTVVVASRVVITQTMAFAFFVDAETSNLFFHTAIKDDERSVYYELILDRSDQIQVTLYGRERHKAETPRSQHLEHFRNVNAFSRIEIHLEVSVTTEDIEKGAGPAVAIGDKVYLRFIIYLHDLNGMEHASNTSGKKSFTFVVGDRRGTIKGFSDGVVGMRRSGRRVIFVPAHMTGDPSRHMRPVPKGACLFIECLLLKVKKSPSYLKYTRLY